MPPSNTRACFTECIGKKVIGVLFDAVPTDGPGTKTLVFDDGTGLCISRIGAFWRVRPKEIQRATEENLRRFQEVQNELRGVLALAERKTNGKRGKRCAT